MPDPYRGTTNALVRVMITCNYAWNEAHSNNLWLTYKYFTQAAGCVLYQMFKSGTGLGQTSMSVCAFIKMGRKQVWENSKTGSTANLPSQVLYSRNLFLLWCIYKLDLRARIKLSNFGRKRTIDWIASMPLLLGIAAVILRHALQPSSYWRM